MVSEYITSLLFIRRLNAATYISTAASQQLHTTKSTTQLAYKCERTRDLYNVIKHSCDRYGKFLLIIPKMLYALINI